ncbi:Methyltransferase sdnD (Sordarin/hypoxysordarin biosynthesis cluster protein D) [Durusdinium trenchii]|uniref:Methyltransferase sdnD (Sordarin/hypoxysordarin biosynthesis cluster protein D) n=1 Tax=Durusdinium trenchii TaxID=1381693 RepID=A0ABP0QZ70_9DINO
MSSRPKVVVDAGMNLGVFSLFVRRFLPSTTCLAFEPAPEVLHMAVRSLREANVPVELHGGAELPKIADDGQVHVFQMALSDRSGTRSFTHFPQSPANSALSEHRPEQRWPEGAVPQSVELQVTCGRLGDVLEGFSDQGVEVFLKVDVEGAEVDLLRGLEPHWAQISAVAMEVTKASLQEVLSLCQQHGLELEHFKQPSAGAQDVEELYMVYGCRDVNA